MPDADAARTPRSPAVIALLANVDRLLNDSETLLAAGGTASAASLATVAFEECGKLYALRFDLAPADAGTDLPRYHQAVALIGLGLAILRKYAIEQESFYAAILPSAWGPSTDVGADDLAERLKDVVKTTLEPIMAGQSPEMNVALQGDVRGLVEIGKLVKAGAVGRIRTWGLQVGTRTVEGVGAEVASDPAAVTRDMAERWAWAADGLFHLLQQDDVKHPGAREVAILIEALGRDDPAQRFAA